MKEVLFNELIASVREAGKILRGEAAAPRSFVVDVPKVRVIRGKYRLSQSEFAAMLGISVQTLRNWEQGRRAPDGPARVLLQVAAKHPEAVWDVVRPATSQKPEKPKRRGRVA